MVLSLSDLGHVTYFDPDLCTKPDKTLKTLQGRSTDMTRTHFLRREELLSCFSMYSFFGYLDLLGKAVTVVQAKLVNSTLRPIPKSPCRTLRDKRWYRIVIVSNTRAFVNRKLIPATCHTRPVCLGQLSDFCHLPSLPNLHPGSLVTDFCHLPRLPFLPSLLSHTETYVSCGKALPPSPSGKVRKWDASGPQTGHKRLTSKEQVVAQVWQVGHKQ